MNYNSPSFWCLVAGAWAIYWRVSHPWQNALLLVASYAFYASWDPRFLLAVLVTTVVAYVGGLGAAGEVLSSRGRVIGALTLTGAAVVLGSGVEYVRLIRGAMAADASVVRGALPTTWQDGHAALLIVVACVLGVPLLAWVDRLETARRRRSFLLLTLGAHLALLGYAKYSGFFVESALSLLKLAGFDPIPTLALRVALPIGISFYTFQAMSYTIDVYRGALHPMRNVLGFALYVGFFPPLVAGPITRASVLLPQILRPRRRETADLETGMALILMGLVKKLVIADNMAPVASAEHWLDRREQRSLPLARALLGAEATLSCGARPAWPMPARTPSANRGPERDI